MSSTSLICLLGNEIVNPFGISSSPQGAGWFRMVETHSEFLFGHIQSMEHQKLQKM
jgi:hypothetical protein